jgi:phage major head subunit gpT-like protein
VKQNVLAGTARVIVHPDITGGVWFLIDASSDIRPFVVAKRKEPQFVAKDSVDDDAVFWRKKYHYGVDARGAAAYGPYFLAARAEP